MKSVFTAAAAVAVMLSGTVAGNVAHAQCVQNGVATACAPAGTPSINTSQDPAFGYDGGRGSSSRAAAGAAATGPDPGGGFNHQGQMNVGHSN